MNSLVKLVHEWLMKSGKFGHWADSSEIEAALVATNGKVESAAQLLISETKSIAFQEDASIIINTGMGISVIVPKPTSEPMIEPMPPLPAPTIEPVDNTQEFQRPKPPKQKTMKKSNTLLHPSNHFLYVVLR